MNPKISNWLKSLTKEDYKKMAEEFHQEQEKKRGELKSFFESPRYQEVLSQLKQVVGEDGAMGDNPYQEPLFGNVTNEEFIKLFSIAFDEEMAKTKVQEDNTGPFAMEFVIMENMKFLEIHGQGTAFIVQGLKFKEAPRG